MGGYEALGVAFVSGLLTSASPCTLAALPVTVGYVGGVAHSARRGAALAVALVAGMTVALVVLGVVAARAGMLLGALPGPWIVAVGAFLLAAGIGVALGWLEEVIRPPAAIGPRLARSGIPGAAVVGALLGTVMSPCAAPALAVALTLAGTGAWLDGSAWSGIALLVAYSLGRGMVILAAGSLPALAQALAAHAAAWAKWIPGRRVFGSLLAGAGCWWISQGLVGL